jgi:RNA methyltransferase, TrmH family
LPTRLGRHSERLSRVRALKTSKGRREQHRFGFEGTTLLDEALRSGVEIEELYVTQAAYDNTPSVRDLDDGGTSTFVVDDRISANLSDVETPSGILAVAPARFRALDDLFVRDGTVLVLADLNDPGNAGTLLRAADAFGALGVVFGRAGVDPYHPKVVRAAMGALFRLGLALGDPAGLASAASAGAFEVVGLATGATPLESASWPARSALVVGHERRGLGSWAEACDRLLSIRMTGPSESLNAAIAGSIALHEAIRNRH